MASQFFAIFDDVVVLMEDVATMSKYATQKTSGILADDLAVNAEKASGFSSERELSVLWKITKGSLLNKLVILPAVFLLSAYLPVVIIPILLIGGLYLAYEGAEKIYKYLFDKNKAKEQGLAKKNLSEAEIVAYENEKVKSAILVDFILSVEIVIIALSTVSDQSLNMQIIVVSIVALLATVFVYGLVGLLVRIDDFGYSLMARSNRKGSFLENSGKTLVKTLPFIVKSLGVIGTVAMILVAGGIFVHNIESIHHFVDFLPSLLGEFLVGLVIGFVCLLIIKGILKVIGK